MASKLCHKICISIKEYSPWDTEGMDNMIKKQWCYLRGGQSLLFNLNRDKFDKFRQPINAYVNPIKVTIQGKFGNEIYQTNLKSLIGNLIWVQQSYSSLGARVLAYSTIRNESNNITRYTRVLYSLKQGVGSLLSTKTTANSASWGITSTSNYGEMVDSDIKSGHYGWCAQKRHYLVTRPAQ